MALRQVGKYENLPEFQKKDFGLSNFCNAANAFSNKSLDFTLWEDAHCHNVFIGFVVSTNNIKKTISEFKNSCPPGFNKDMVQFISYPGDDNWMIYYGKSDSINDELSQLDSFEKRFDYLTTNMNRDCFSWMTLDNKNSEEAIALKHKALKLNKLLSEELTRYFNV